MGKYLEVLCTIPPSRITHQLLWGRQESREGGGKGRKIKSLPLFLLGVGHAKNPETHTQNQGAGQGTCILLAHTWQYIGRVRSYGAGGDGECEGNGAIVAD